MHLVDHDPLERGKQFEAVGIAEQQRQAFGRGQQDMRRLLALAALAVRRRIAAACLDPQWQAHFLNRGNEIALHVMRQCLQWRNIERVQPLRRVAIGDLRRAEIGQRRKEPRQRLARTRICHQQCMLATPVGGEHPGLMRADTPATPGKPRFDLGRDRHRVHARPAKAEPMEHMEHSPDVLNTPATGPHRTGATERGAMAIMHPAKQIMPE